MKLKNNIFVSSILVVAMLSFAACTKVNDTKLLDGVVVINVLERELYDDCHIVGSVSVPFEQLEAYARDHISPSADIVVHCSNYLCSASGQGVKILKRLGFKNVTAYEGGTAEWYQHKLPVEGPCKASYLHKQNVKMNVDIADADLEISTIALNELKIKLHVS